MKRFITLLVGVLFSNLTAYPQGITIGLKAGWTDNFLKFHYQNSESNYVNNGFYPNEFFPGITGGIQGNIP